MVFMLDIIMKQHGVADQEGRARTMMVGDRLDTDVKFGNTGGMNTLLVLSGCTSLDFFEGVRSEKGGAGDTAAPNPQPTYYAASIASLLN